MTGAEAIIRSLEAEGVDDMFGIPGGAILPTYDAIGQARPSATILARHEQGAGHMAEGYARASGRVGVAIATSGPGATNLVTPIADAWMDSTPIVCITGQVPSHLIGTDAFQETDATGHHDADRQALVARAGRRASCRTRSRRRSTSPARAGPGPVLVDIAKDVQEAEFDFSYPAEADLPGCKPPRHGASSAGARGRRGDARGRAARSSTPAAGVTQRRATAELLALVEALQLPAVITLMGKGGLPDSHPLSLRRCPACTAPSTRTGR